MNETFNPEEFGKWLTNAFNESRFKSWEEVAKLVGSTRSTLSRYAGAKPQTNTGKASQPRSELVIKLAKVFEKDVNEALMIAGHAPTSAPTMRKPANVAEFFERLDEMGLGVKFEGGIKSLEGLDEDDLQDLLDDMSAMAVTRANKKKK